MVNTRVFNSSFSARKDLTKPPLPKRQLIRQVIAAASAPTVTFGTTTAMTGTPQLVPLMTDSSSYNLGSQPQSLFSFTRGVLDPTNLGGLGATFANVTINNTPTYGIISAGIEFMHYGASLEIQFGVSAGKFFQIKVDDQYVSLTANSLTTNSFYKLDFSSVGGAAARRITVFGNTAPRFVSINPTDAIWPAQVRGPRTIIIGDSFTAGSGASSATASNFAAWLSDFLGWDDIWASGVGGTGYLATNGGVANTFRQRLAHDVIPFNPDIVWIVGSVNDDGADPTAMLAEATLLYQTIQAALPNTLIVVSPTAKKGVGTWANNKLQVKDAMKAAVAVAAASSNNILWADPIEQPFVNNGPNPLSGIIHTASTVGATTISVEGVLAKAGYPQPYGTFDIGSGATRERIQVKSSVFGGTFNSGNNYFFTVTPDSPMQYAHAIGETWKQVGGCYLTGHGQVGTTTGWGDCDLLTSSDGTHPTDAGHVALADALTSAFVTAAAV